MSPEELKHEHELAILRAAQTGGATLAAFTMWAGGELRRRDIPASYRELNEAGRRCVQAKWLNGKRKGGASQYRDDIIHRLTQAGKDHLQAHPQKPRTRRA